MRRRSRAVAESSKEMLLNKELKVAIGGLGEHSRRRHIGSFDHLPGVEVVAGFDPDQRARNIVRADRGIPVYATQRELHENGPEHDLVLLVVPDAYHVSEIEYALERGKHVACEKPLALDLDEVRGLMDHAREHELVLAQILQRKFMLEDLAARSARGEFGELIRFELDWLIPDGTPVHRNLDHGTGVLGDLYPHVASQLLPFVGGAAPVNVWATASSAYGGHGVEDSCVCAAEFPGSGSSLTKLAWHSHFDRETSLARIYWSDATATLPVLTGHDRREARAARGTLARRKNGRTVPTPLDPLPTTEDCHALMAAEVVGRVRNYDAEVEARHHEADLWVLDLVVRSMRSAGLVLAGAEHAPRLSERDPQRAPRRPSRPLRRSPTRPAASGGRLAKPPSNHTGVPHDPARAHRNPLGRDTAAARRIRSRPDRDARPRQHHHRRRQHALRRSVLARRAARDRGRRRSWVPGRRQARSRAG
jgi:predicted dehydrogenase